MATAERVVLAADKWLTARKTLHRQIGARGPHGERDRTLDIFEAEYVRAEADLEGATADYRAAIARQSVDDPEVYVQNKGHHTDRKAAAAAMLVRATWRKCVYEMLSVKPMSDYGMEMFCRDQYEEAVPGSPMWLYYGPDNTRAHRIGRPTTRSQPTHQSISSARKSLVDAGLVYNSGDVEMANGRPHILWAARTIEAAHHFIDSQEGTHGSAH